MRRARVLHIMASGARGGGANHLLGLLPELVRLGISCTVAAGDDGPLVEELASLGIDAEPLTLMWSRLDPSAPARLASRIRSCAPHIVHVHGTRAAYFSALARASRLRWPKTIYTAHGLSYRKQAPRPLKVLAAVAERIACAGADHVISVSLADLDDLRRRGYVATTGGTHIPNAVHHRRVASTDVGMARSRLRVPDSAFVVGTVARLVPQKSVSDLVEAMRYCDGAYLVVVGDGPERRTVETTARRFGGRVQLLGERDDVLDLLGGLDVFALSSRWEGEPIALLEALAAGLPCVATATAGALEVLQGSGAGVLVPCAEPRALGEAIGQLRNSPSVRAAMGKAGQALMAKRTYSAQAKRVDRVYGELLGART